jgi:UDP-glucose 4-epimerase
LKKVLITGANSYVGTNVEKWLMKEPENFYVETLDMKDPNWKSFDFSRFDIVFHVAGIAHVSTKKSMKDLYFKVNRDLTIEVAKKAKESGVKQFIFMSSMIVYNSKETKITIETMPNPDNFYGLSKLEAENQLKMFKNENFTISIIRPPMIYGPNSKGNFGKLKKLSLKVIIFPNYQNKRSMLFIDNLSIFIKYIIDYKQNDLVVYWPQNDSYSSTSNLVEAIRKINNKKTIKFKVFNPIISILKNKIQFLNKMFSDFYYDMKDHVLPSFKNLNDSLIEMEKIKSDE